MAEECSLAFAKLAEVAIALGAAPLTKNPGNWKHTLPDGWRVEVNGRDEETDGIPAYSAIVFVGETPAAILNPANGIFLRGAEDDFIASCETELVGLREEGEARV